MKRPLLVVGVCAALGTWASFFFAFSSLILSLCFAAAGGVLYLLRRKARLWSVILLSLALGMGLSASYQQRIILPLQQAVGSSVRFEGMVIQLDTLPPVSYDLTVRGSFREDYPDTTLVIRGYGEPDFFPGDGIACDVSLEHFKGSISYQTRGVYLGARLEQAWHREELSLFQQVERFFLRARDRMRGNLYENLSAESAGVLSAMVLGNRSGISQDVTWALSRAGTVHLLSVSGLHLSVLVGCVNAFLRHLKVNRRLSALIGAAAAIAFAFLVGFSPSITRALVMMLTLLAAQLFSQRSDPLNSLGLALLLICIFFPQWSVNPGLWLSASSTAGILVLSDPLTKRIDQHYLSRGKIAPRLAKIFLHVGAISLCAYAFSFPVLLLSSGWVPLISPVANLLIAPLTLPALLGGMLCALLPAAPLPLAWLTDTSTSLIISISRWLSGAPTFALSELWRLIWFLLLATVVILLLYCKADRSLWRYGATLLLLAFAVGSVTLSAVRRDQVEVVSFDNCGPIILILDGSAVVVGTPNAYEIGRLSRYLEFRGIHQLDAVYAYDCGEQISSGLLRLVEEGRPALVLGPDDAYILSQMERALRREVVSVGYATTEVLGGVRLEAFPLEDGVRIQIGNNLVIQSGEFYDIMDRQDGIISISRNQIGWTESTPLALEPMGALLFGERRIILNL